MNKSSVKLSILAFFFLISSTIKSQDIFDMCSQITSAYQTNATDTLCESFGPISIEGNFNNATPEIEISDCLSSNSPTVWMKVKVDENALKLGTSGKARNIENNIVWSIYYGSCGDLTLLNGGTIADPCVCSHCDEQDEIHVVGLIDGITEYYIAVSLDGDIATDEGFDFNIWTSADCVSCIGEDGCVPLADFSIIKRSSDRPLEDPTFCPEEEVTVCIEYTYDASETGVDWLHGLIPNFGNGWDMSSFNPNDVDFSPPLAEWSVADTSPCAPFITENMPYLCTYVDSITGLLKLCHTGCQTCPCVGPLTSGSPLPSGWFFNSNGGEGCANDCSPSSHWGIGQVVVNINFCMDLKVQSIENIENGKADRNLQISFQTTSDGVSGCWEDPVAECVLDFAQIGPRWKINTSTSYLSVPNDTSIVEGNPLSLEISLNNNLPSNDDIYIDYEPNPYVLGMQKDTFENGMGVVTDLLTNITDSLQLVTYLVSNLNESNHPCGNNVRKILVYVYPNGSYRPVTVTTYHDLNKNGYFDVGAENVLPSFRIYDPSLNYSFFTNENGRAHFFTSKDSLDISGIATWGNWIQSQVDSTFVTNDTLNDFYIGFNEKIDSTVKVITFINAFARCNTATFTQLGVTNTSPRLPISGKIIYTYDTKINVSDSTDPPTNIDQLNRKIVWDFANLSPGNSLDLRHFFVAPGISTTSDSLAFTMTVILDSGDTLAHKRFATLLRCSYDPNDKSVYPDRAGDENYLLRTEDLQYTIRFQNIGNDTAFNVLIQDVLDPSLDINTLHVLYASHDLNTQAKGDSVYFIFDNIRLPDSLRSPVESNGFVIFNIKPKADLPENTQIYNQASIYFDQNEPIITHKILNTLVEKLPCPIDAIFIENSDITVNKDLDKYEWYNCVNDSLVFTSTIPQFTPTQNGSYYCIITGRFCNAKTKCILYDLISSITDYTSTFVKIYPNPGQDRVTIELKDIIKDAQIAAMTDTKGNHWPVESSRISDNMHSIDTANMPQGVYVIYILDGNGTKYMVKWIKI